MPPTPRQSTFALCLASRASIRSNAQMITIHKRRQEIPCKDGQTDQTDQTALTPSPLLSVIVHGTLTIPVICP
ncbi:hypothetical protein Vi05172_g9094 [Venturia inaequalis]|nr:hypothetical protein Vi05172_g9094 [Venturia inaequalis]